MSSALHEYPELIQGSAEWLSLRKTKITSTDASVIMGVNPWKTKLQLYNEKKSEDVKPLYINERMQRGIDLEPVARELFNLKNGWNMKPAIIIDDWRMSSLDGLDPYFGYILEIKCPGEKDHSLALSGKIPEYYYPQLQHAMSVCNQEMMFYYSFDGIDGVSIKVFRDEKYIDKMIDEEYKFYQCLLNNTPPEPIENDFILRNDDIWNDCASNWKTVTEMIKRLENQQEELRKQLIHLSGGSNTKGAGISLSQVTRKGNVDYSKIPELQKVDLEIHRKPSQISWRINS